MTNVTYQDTSGVFVEKLLADSPAQLFNNETLILTNIPDNVVKKIATK